VSIVYTCQIQNLGPRKDKSVPVEIIDENGDVVREEEIVFGRLRRVFHELYNCSGVIKNNKTIFIDLKRCFDYIDRDMLLYKLLLNNIDVKLYNSVKSTYTSSTSTVRINTKMTERFDCRAGMKQRYNLSQTLLSISANDLVAQVNDLDLEINVGDGKL